MSFEKSNDSTMEQYKKIESELREYAHTAKTGTLPTLPYMQFLRVDLKLTDEQFCELLAYDKEVTEDIVKNLMVWLVKPFHELRRYCNSYSTTRGKVIDKKISKYWLAYTKLQHAKGVCM